MNGSPNALSSCAPRRTARVAAPALGRTMPNLSLPSRAQRLGFRQQGVDPAGQLLQQLVAAAPADLLVHGLELVDIEQEQRGGAALAIVAGDRRLQPVDEQGAVGEAGQLVVLAEPDDPRRIRPAQRDVADRRHRRRHAVMLDGLAAQLHRQLGLVEAAQAEFRQQRLRRLQLGAQRRHLVRPRQIGEMLAHPFALAAAQHPHQRPVHLQNRAAAMHQQAVETGIGQLARPLLLPFLLAVEPPLALADVDPEHADHQDHHQRRQGHRRHEMVPAGALGPNARVSGFTGH